MFCIRCIAILFALYAFCSEAVALTYGISPLGDETVIISVEGEFLPTEDFTGFLDALEKAGSRRIGVTFDSIGGNPGRAIALGRIIRAFKLPTIQFRGQECASACALAFMGGIYRFAEPGSIGVHKSSFTARANLSLEDAVSAVQQQTAETIAYMTDMGIDPALLQLSLSYESDDIRYLSKSEMTRYRLITGELTDSAPPASSSVASSASTPSSLPTIAPPATPQASVKPLHYTVPKARTGRVRVPKGFEHLRASESQNSAKQIRVNNGDSVHIIGISEKWYRVRAKGETGFLHHNWVKVDQFYPTSFDHRFVQVKSFDNPYEVTQYIASSNLPLSSYLATNGWYAVALDKTYTAKTAKMILDDLKSKGAVPDDAFVTTGNTYMVKTCCTAMRN